MALGQLLGASRVAKWPRLGDDELLELSAAVLAKLAQNNEDNQSAPGIGNRPSDSFGGDRKRSLRSLKALEKGLKRGVKGGV